MSKIKIEEQVKDTFGVDLKDYRDEDVAESLLDLITFPRTALSYILKGIGIGLLIYILGFFIFDLTGIDYGFYAIFGLIGNIFLTIVYTVYRFLDKIKSDIVGIIKYSLDILGNITMLPQVKKNLNKDNTSLLFKGVLLGVIAPVVTEKTSDKIPVIGGVIAALVTRMLDNISKVDPIGFNNSSEENDDNILEIEKSDSLSMKIETVINKSISVVQKPFYYLSIASLIFNSIFIYLIW